MRILYNQEEFIDSRASESTKIEEQSAASVLEKPP